MCVALRCLASLALCLCLVLVLIPALTRLLEATLGAKQLQRGLNFPFTIHFHFHFLPLGTHKIGLIWPNSRLVRQQETRLGLARFRLKRKSRASDETSTLVARALAQQPRGAGDSNPSVTPSHDKREL